MRTARAYLFTTDKLRIIMVINVLYNVTHTRLTLHGTDDSYMTLRDCAAAFSLRLKGSGPWILSTSISSRAILALYSEFLNMLVVNTHASNHADSFIMDGRVLRRFTRVVNVVG